MENHLFHHIALTKVPLVGAVVAKNLIAYCGSAAAVFDTPKRDLRRIPGIGPLLAENIVKQKIFKETEEELLFIEKHKVKALTFLDDDYPQRLRQYNDSPIVLYYKGNADLNPSRIVSIVGTRKPSTYGRSICEELVAGLKDYNVMIVSGLAYGIDVCAHKKSLESGIETIGVLGHGLQKIYPATHKDVARKMIQQGGLLTEYPSGTDAEREHFPMRNRIVAGMCDALIVVETNRKGGSMISAEIANGYFKDVFAIPGRPKDPQSKGCNYLIKSHKAALIESADDLIQAMNWDHAGPPKSQQTELFIELSPEEKVVVDLLRVNEELSIDQLTLKTCTNSSQMASTLLGLEFKGLLKPLPGKRYILSR